MLTKPCRLPSVFTLHKMANLAFSRMLREQYADGSAGKGPLFQHCLVSIFGLFLRWLFLDPSRLS